MRRQLGTRGLTWLVLGGAPVVLLGSLGAACSSSEPAGGASGGSASGVGGSGSGSPIGSGGSSGSSATSPLHGGIVVALNEPTDSDGYTTLIGRFFDAAQPISMPLELDTKQGDCSLLVPKLPFCSEPCTPAVCTADDVCTAYPKPLGVGTLSVTGLGDALTLEPATSMVAYQSPSLAYPPCAEGDPIAASAMGVSLEAPCIPPLELTGPDPIPVAAGAAVQLSWEPAASGAISRVRISLDLSHHGGSKGEINCDVPDTGSFSIPEPLITKLVGLGLAGFPTITLNRVSIGTDPTHPAVSLVLTSDITRAVDTGVTSCLDHSDCEAPELCQDGGTCG